MTEKEKEKDTSTTRKMSDEQVAKFVAEKRKLPPGVKSVRYVTRAGKSTPIVVWK